MENLNNLPKEVIAEVKKVLKAYKEVDVVFENGKYHCFVGTFLKSTYGADRRFVGTYFAKDVYTERERIINYINEFNEYPINYKGARDYNEIKKAKPIYNPKTHTMKVAIWDMDNNGNLQLVGSKII